MCNLQWVVAFKIWKYWLGIRLSMDLPHPPCLPCSNPVPHQNRPCLAQEPSQTPVIKHKSKKSSWYKSSQRKKFVQSWKRRKHWVQICTNWLYAVKSFWKWSFLPYIIYTGSIEHRNILCTFWFTSTYRKIAFGWLPTIETCHWSTVW